MKTFHLIGEKDPALVIDGSNCRVSVCATFDGTYLLFDTENGEFRYRIQDDEWRELTEAVYIARKNVNWANRGVRYCLDCGERNEDINEKEKTACKKCGEIIEWGE